MWIVILSVWIIFFVFVHYKIHEAEKFGLQWLDFVSLKNKEIFKELVELTERRGINELKFIKISRDVGRKDWYKYTPNCMYFLNPKHWAIKDIKQLPQHKKFSNWVEEIQERIKTLKEME